MTHNDFSNVLGSESRLRSTLESLLEGAQILDRDWRYLYVNPAAARHGGKSVDELVGRTILESYPGIEETQVFSVLRNVMETREPAEMENEFEGPDGSVKWFQLLIQPVTEGLFILSIDITGKKEAESALDRDRARFAAVVDGLREGLIIASLDGALLHWNQAALSMLGLRRVEDGLGPREQLASEYQLSTLEGEILAPAESPLARVLRGETVHDIELRVVHLQQHWEKVFAYSGSTVQYASGESVAFLTLRDVTARKELERRFARAQRLESVGTLAGGIAHDLNNILMPILMATTTLRRFGSDERATRIIDTVERSAKRGADLVRQILSFARGASTWSSAIDMREIIGELLPIVRSTFPKNVGVSIHVADDLRSVSGDATQLLQVLLNLAINARDAMPRGGRIVISARNEHLNATAAASRNVTPGDYLRLDFTDNGSGMSAEVIGRIFDPFFTTKEAGKGTGLGLYTVQDIVKSHGGFVSVRSAPGQGSTFTIQLPVSRVENGPSRDEAVLEEIERGRGELILLVDDEASILAVMQQTLEVFGYRVLTAEDGARAIAQFARSQEEIALVITDMMMGVVDGAAVIAALRGMNPDLPVVATSGDSSDDWSSRARAAGAKYVLAKPYTAPLLLRIVREILNESRADA
jgi:PAS domain S-box-containing protein